MQDSAPDVESTSLGLRAVTDWKLTFSEDHDDIRREAERSTMENLHTLPINL